MKKTDSFIERRIVTGLILNDEFCEKLKPLLKIKWLKSEESKRIASWCFNYYTKYNKAPKKEIQNIYYEKMDSLEATSASLIEETLFSLSEDFKRLKKFNVEYLLDQAEKYIQKRQLQDLIDSAQDELDNGELLEAKLIASNFKPIERVQSNAIEPLTDPDMIRKVLEDQYKPLYHYGDTPYGRLVNRSLCRDCFVAYMAQNKGGKSFVLLDNVFRAAFAGCNVLYFQAGDMSVEQVMRRQGIWLLKRSDRPEFCQEVFIPVLDCVYSQNGNCDLKQRRSKISPFEGYMVSQLRGESRQPDIENVTNELLKERVLEETKYKPCTRCIKSTDPKMQKNYLGTIWYKVREPVQPLHWKDVYHTVQKKYLKKMQRIKIISYPSDTLTMSMVKQEWDVLEKQGFIPDVCVIDYFDIMAADMDTKQMSRRDQEGYKWSRGRSLSTIKKALVLGATQSDASSFDAKILSKKHFSEDKRKLDHATDIFGINMNKNEKKKGIARYNSIVTRENDGDRVVHVLHRLQIGKPYLGSYY